MVSEIVWLLRWKKSTMEIFMSTAGPLRLHRRTSDRAERAENATIARLGTQASAAVRAIVQEQARVGRHPLALREATNWTGDYRFQHHLLHARSFSAFSLALFAWLLTLRRPPIVSMPRMGLDRRCDSMAVACRLRTAQHDRSDLLGDFARRDGRESFLAPQHAESSLNHRHKPSGAAIAGPRSCIWSKQTSSNELIVPTLIRSIGATRLVSHDERVCCSLISVNKSSDFHV